MNILGEDEYLQILTFCVTLDYSILLDDCRFSQMENALATSRTVTPTCQAIILYSRF